MPKSNDNMKVGGFLIIRRYRNGELVWQSDPMPNKVVMSSGHGRNLIVRQLAGDTTYGVEIDSAELGDNNTAAVDADTDLIGPIVTAIPITNKTAVDDELTVDVFVADGNLPDDTYEEFGLRIGARMFCRVIISPAYTKASGEDTLFTYTMSLASS